MAHTGMNPATLALLAPCSKLHYTGGWMPDVCRDAWKQIVLLTAIWPATSMHTKGFTLESSTHLYCWPDSQDSNKHRSEMCAICPTGTPGLSSITHFNVSDLELLSPFNMQSRNWEKDCSTKYIALRKAWWTLRQGRLTYCYLCFCSVLTLYYWTWTQTIQSVRVTDFFFGLINKLS